MEEKEYIRKTKLITVLSTLSKEDIRKLKKFVHSPYHNENQLIKNLFDFLITYYPTFEHKNVSYEKIIKKLDPSEKSNKMFVTRLFSKLFKILEEFLAIHNSSADELEQQNHNIEKLLRLLRFYNKNHHETLFKQTLAKLDKVLGSYPFRNENYFNFMHLREVESCSYLSAKMDKGTGDINFQPLNDRLDQYYFFYKLKLFSLMINREQVVQFEYNQTFFDMILKADINHIKDHSVLVVWRQVVDFLQKRHDKQNYEKLKAILKENNHLLTQSDSRNIHIYLENMLLDLPAGSDAFYEEYFNLYQQQLDMGIVYIDGLITPIVFRNIFTVAIRLKKLEWAYNFLEQHKDKIDKEYLEKEDIYTLCLAAYNFEIGNMDEALSLLNQIGFISLHTKLEEKRIRLKVYAELKLDLLLHDLINSFRKFLSENKSKIHPYHIEANRKFINILLATSNIVNLDRQKLQAIIKQIEDTKNLPDRSWLKEKTIQILEKI